MLFIDGHSIKSFNLSTHTARLVAGNVNISGHRSSTGQQSRFDNPHDMIQDTVHKRAIIVDRDNGCLRAMKYSTSAVKDLAGKCGNLIAADGEKNTGSLSSPHLIKKLTTRSFIVADSGDRTLKLVSTSKGVDWDIRTVYRLHRAIAQEMVVNLDSEYVLVCVASSYGGGIGIGGGNLIIKINTNNWEFQEFWHNNIYGFKDGDARAAQIGKLFGDMVFVERDVLLLLDKENNKVRVINTEETQDGDVNKFSTLCLSTSSCDTPSPDSAVMVKRRLVVLISAGRQMMTLKYAGK